MPKVRNLLIALLCLLSAAAQAQERMDFSKIQEKVTKVAGNIYMIESTGGFGGGNIGVSVGDDGIVIVDDKFAPLAEKIQAVLKTISDKPVRFVLNTHFHGDHTHGNRVWGKNASIIAHENVRKRLLLPDPDSKEATPPVALPVITFDHSATVHLNGEDVRALHFPSGHTDGDSVIFFTQSNVIHMGDDMFNGMFPFVDLESGGSIPGCIQAVESVLKEAKPDTKFIPGHGPLASLDDLKNYLAMLKESYQIVSAGVKQGKTLEQLKQQKVLSKFDNFGGGFMKTDQYLEQLYNDATGKKKNFM
jgi:glyoxylase-like metal-dependent hydrolase (beta-lactamase superfamily II)